MTSSNYTILDIVRVISLMNTSQSHIVLLFLGISLNFFEFIFCSFDFLGGKCGPQIVSFEIKDQLSVTL